jgi:flagellar protein FliS
MIYDHCIKWTKKADEELASNRMEPMVRAVQRVQNGLTELMCSLDMEKGGEIAKNLFRLYEFYSRHLTMAIRNRSVQCLRDVSGMMSVLREAWLVAIENVRRDSHTVLANATAAQLSLVS